MANYEEAARKFAEALKASGLSAEEAAKAIRDLTDKTKNYEKSAKDGTRSVKTFTEAFNTYDKSLEKVGQSLSRVFETMKTAFLGGTAAALVGRVGDFQKGLYDLSRQATATGQTFTMFSKTMEDMGKKTALSREESAKFLKQVQDSSKGVKLMGEEISNLAKTLSDEFGPKLQDVQNSFKTLAEIQQKDIMLFSRLREGMRGPEFGNYVASMVLAHKLTNEQAETLLRVNRQKVLGAQAIDEETKKLRQFQDVQQKFHQAFSNLAISLGKPLMEIFIQVIKPLTAFGEKLSNLMEKNKAFAGMVGGVAKILAWSAIAATVVGAMSAMASKLSGAFQMIKSVTSWGVGKIVPVRIVSGGVGGGPAAVAEHLTGKGGAASAATGAVTKSGAIKSVAGGDGSVVGGAASGALGMLGKIVSFLGPIGLVVGAITELASVVLPLIGDFTSIGNVIGLAQDEIDKMNESFAEVKEALLGAFGEVWKSLKELGRSMITAMMPMIKLYQQVVPQIIAAFTPMAQALIKAQGAIFGAFMKLQIVLMKVILPIATLVFTMLAKAIEFMADKLELLAWGLGEAFDAIIPILDEFAGTMTALIDMMPTWLGGSGKTPEDRAKERDARTKAELGRDREKRDKDVFAEFLAKEMGVKKEEIDVNKEAERIKQITGKGISEALKDKGLLQADVRLRKAGVDVAKPGAEGAIGIGRISSIQAILAQELAARKASGKSEEDQKQYRQEMEQAAVQGNLGIMSPEMRKALVDTSKDKGSFGKSIAQAPAGMKELLKPDSIKAANEAIESGAEYSTLIAQRTKQANEYYESLSQNIAAANALLSENAETALQMGNNTELYRKNLEEAMGLSEKQLVVAKAMSSELRGELETERLTLEAKLKQAIAIKDTRAMKEAETALTLNAQARSGLQNNINKALQEQLKIALQIVEANKLEIEVRDAELGLLESQMNLSKALFAGMGPTLALQGQMLSKIDEQISAYEQQNAEAKKQIEDLQKKKDIEGNIPTLQKKILENETKMTQAKLKQVELTKALRDQYLEAITSFTQMEGAFSKFVISRESGVGEAMRNFGMQGGLGVGVKGAGATNPLMQWGAGGNVQFQPMQQMMNFFKQYQGAAGYSDFKGMVPFGGWAENTPAGSSMLQGFNAGSAEKERMNQMTHPGAGGGGGSPKGPPLDGGLNVINETLKNILKAIMEQANNATKDSVKNDKDKEKKDKVENEKKAEIEKQTKATEKIAAQQAQNALVPKEAVVVANEKAVGVPAMALGGLVKLAGGGQLPGYGGGDSVPALLEQGEFVVNKDAARAYAPLLASINAQKFANGGPVVPKPETALAGGGGHPRVNINVRGDSAAAIKKVVMDELDATLDATMSPTGSHARLYDPTL